MAYGKTDLLIAVDEGDIIAFEELLQEFGQSINQSNDANGNSFLHRAIAKGKWRMAEYLIDSGIDVNILNKEGESALLKAVSNDFRGITIVRYKEVLEKLIQNGADINCRDTSTEESSYMGEVGFTPASASVYYNNPVSVEMLISEGADLSITTESGKNCLFLAAGSGDYEVFKKVLADTPTHHLDDVDKYGMTAIHTVCCTMDSSCNLMLEDLILNGADINKVDANGFSPLMLTATQQVATKTKLLLEYGADFNYINPADGKDVIASSNVAGANMAILTYYRMKDCIENKPEKVKREPLEFALGKLNAHNKDGLFENEVAHIKEALLRFELKMADPSSVVGNAPSGRRF